MGRSRKVRTRSSISAHRRLTWLLEMPAMPSALTSSSTERVEMPCTYASWITAVRANHLAQEISVGALLQQLAKGDPVVGHRGGLRSGLRVATQPYRRSRDGRPLWITGP